MPYSCVRVIGQVKNSFAQLKEALEQCAISLDVWEKMADEDDHDWEDGVRYDPIAIIIIGKGGDDAHARKILASARSPRAAYVLLAEPGLLYVPENPLRKVLSHMKDKFYMSQLNNSPLCLIDSGSEPMSRGRILLRLFFAVVQHAASKDTKAFNKLMNSIEEKYPLKYSTLPAISLKPEIRKVASRTAKIISVRYRKIGRGSKRI